jgi:hypothetical protein
VSCFNSRVESLSSQRYARRLQGDGRTPRGNRTLGLLVGIYPKNLSESSSSQRYERRLQGDNVTPRDSLTLGAFRLSPCSPLGDSATLGDSRTRSPIRARRIGVSHVLAHNIIHCSLAHNII